MKRKKSSTINSNEAEVDVSKVSSYQQKDIDDRLGQMEAMINDKFVDINDSIKKTWSENKTTMMENYLKISESVLVIQTLVAEKKRPIAIKRDLKQGVLKATFNIDNIPNEGGSVISNKTHCAGADWWLDVRKTENGTKLGAYLIHKADSANISYDANYTVRLLGSPRNTELKGKSCFTSSVPGLGWHSFILWSKLVNFTNGFVDEKGNFKMEVEFSVTGNTTFCATLDPQFLTCGLVESDSTLLVQERRFPVNKMVYALRFSCPKLLAGYSTYFKTLFFGRFREKDQDEIELKEVCAEEFLHLLKVIYPPYSDADLNQNNVEILLRSADCYQVKSVLDRCSQYLKKCAISEVPLQDKLMYAQSYGLSELLDHCIKEFKTLVDVKKLCESGQYSLLDKDIKLRIYEKVSGITS